VLYVTVDEFARAYMVTRQSVWNWIRAGLPAIWIGDRRFGCHMIPWVEARDVLERDAGLVPRKNI
jgi:hypothetical protein